MIMLAVNLGSNPVVQYHKSPVYMPTLINQCVVNVCQRFGNTTKPDGNAHILEEQKDLINTELAVSSLMLFPVQRTS